MNKWQLSFNSRARLYYYYYGFIQDFWLWGVGGGGRGGGERVREGIMEWVWVLVDFDENLDVFGEK